MLAGRNSFPLFCLKEPKLMCWFSKVKTCHNSYDCFEKQKTKAFSNSGGQLLLNGNKKEPNPDVMDLSLHIFIQLIKTFLVRCSLFVTFNTISFEKFNFGHSVSRLICRCLFVNNMVQEG